MIKKVISLTIPNVVSNITVPLLGMVDLAIVGHAGGGAYIGAIAIGTAIFNIVYWGFGFLRLGTTGLTAQAYGARDLRECGAIFMRSLGIAISVALCILALQYPIFAASSYFMNISETINPIVRDYFFIRVWAAPATLSLYATNGWFMGMQNPKIPMMNAIILNLVNIVGSLTFAYFLGMGVKGVALGTLIAQYSGLIFSLFFIMRYYRKVFRNVILSTIVEVSKLKHFFTVNSDIFLRSVCLILVFTFFTSASSKMGDDILAANTLLLQLFTLASYILDGYAFSAESLAGRYFGAANGNLLRSCVRVVNRFGFFSALAFTLIYMSALYYILSIFTDDLATLNLAMNYRWWIIFVPMTGYLAFIYDGILGGMTKTAIMRNAIFISTALFYILYYTLVPYLGNDAIWLALTVFLLGRGLFQVIMIRRTIKSVP